jgi:hypothetical protein
MLNQVHSTKTFGQAVSLQDAKPQDSPSIENDVFIDIDLCIKRDVLSTSLVRFKSLAPQGRMLVETGLTIEGCLMEETVGSVMVIHIDLYDRLMEGLLNVYFIDSVYQLMNLCLVMKSSEFHFQTSYDIF